MSLVVFFLSWAIFSSLLSAFIGNKWLIILWIPLGYLAGLICFLLFVVLMLHFYFNKENRNPKVVVSFTKSTGYLINRLFFRIKTKVFGTEKIPKSGSAVCYGNHRSKLDATIMLEVLNRPSGFTPKDTLYNIPVLRTWFNNMGSMKIYRQNDRATTREMVKAIHRIKNGLMMIVYPEGTTRNHETNMMDETKTGSYKLALKSEADIVPFSVLGANKIKDNFPWRKTKVYVQFHDPIPFDVLKNMKTSEIDDMVFEIINEGINELQDKYGE